MSMEGRKEGRKEGREEGGTGEISPVTGCNYDR